MHADAWFTLSVLACCFGCLVFTRWAVDAILIAGVAVLMFAGILTPEEALSGMSNQGMITVGILYVVAHGLLRTGVVAWVSTSVLGKPTNIYEAQLRLMLPVAAFSSVLNNTPVVAMMVPATSDWAKRFQLAASQLMIPLSYASIVGGLCTLVGTSTNLIVNDMMLKQDPESGLRMFELARIGLPCVAVTVIYVLLFSRMLLPNRIGALQRFEDARQYIVEMQLEASSPLVGKTIEAAGLRHLPGVYLIEIARDDRLITAVSPTEVLCANDCLVFAGNVESVVDLQKNRGLVPAENQVFKLDSDRSDRCLVEVVISSSFPGLGKSVRDIRFRNRYGAAIIAVSRDGQQICNTKVGDIELKPGDTLLLETHEEFARQQQYSRDFLLVSRVEGSQPLRYEKRFAASAILLAMVFEVSTGIFSMFQAALVAAGLMVMTRCITVHAARQSVDWQVLLVIAASIALGRAVQSTGAAETIAQNMTSLASGSPLTTLAIFFVLTAAFSAVISNIAAAVLMFPIAAASAAQLGVNVTPFAITLMIAASASFATPIGYQTNLMVYGPGDYTSKDFLRMGTPLTILIGLTTCVLVPMIWPF